MINLCKFNQTIWTKQQNKLFLGFIDSLHALLIWPDYRTFNKYARKKEGFL